MFLELHLSIVKSLFYNNNSTIKFFVIWLAVVVSEPSNLGCPSAFIKHILLLRSIARPYSVNCEVLKVYNLNIDLSLLSPYLRLLAWGQPLQVKPTFLVTADPASVVALGNDRAVLQIVAEWFPTPSCFWQHQEAGISNLH